jgi:phage/plasmid-associated DNA primase
LDLRSGLFYDNAKYPFNPKIVFTYKIPHDWVQESEEEYKYRQSVERRMFHEPLGEDVGDFFIYNLARGLAGDVMKRIIFGLGYGNTGKSTLSKALLRSCGGYVDTFNANNLAYRQTGQDSAQQNRWIMLKKDKRIILSNEINSQITLNGNGIKALSSGGDELEGRGHGEAERSFSIQFLTVVFANDLPTIKPYDDAIDKRIRVVSYNKQYVEGEPQNEMELTGDPLIDEEIETVEFQRAFVRILVEKYLEGKDGRFNNDPEKVVAAKQDWIGEEATCLAKFCEDYEITDSPDDYIPSNEIENWLKEKKIGISMKRFGMDMKLNIVKNKWINVETKDKKISGKARKVWFGVKRICETFDGDNCNQ